MEYSYAKNSLICNIRVVESGDCWDSLKHEGEEYKAEDEREMRLEGILSF